MCSESQLLGVVGVALATLARVLALIAATVLSAVAVTRLVRFAGLRVVAFTLFEPSVPSAEVHHRRLPEDIAVIVYVLQSQAMPPMVNVAKIDRVLRPLIAVAQPFREAWEHAEGRRCGLVVDQYLHVLRLVRAVANGHAVAAQQTRLQIDRRAV